MLDSELNLADTLRVTRLILSSILILLAACTAPKKEERKSLSLEQRITSADENKKSQFDRAFNTAGAGDHGIGSVFGKKSAKGKDFGGLKNFHTGAFKTKDFSHGKADRYANTRSSFEDDSMKFGKSNFKTGDAHFGKMSASQGNKMFSGGDDTVSTRTFQPGQKAIEANKRPMITADPNAPQEKVAVTEAEIQRLLGR